MAVAERPIKNALFNELTEEEIRRFMTCFKRQDCDGGQIVFREGDSGNSMYFVHSGLVSLNKEITADVSKKLVLARPGMIFGEFSFMDRAERSATATADEESVLYQLDRPEFDTFIRDNATIGVKVYTNLLGIVVKRLRRTNDAYRDAVRWGLEITGTQKLNFQYLITENVDIRIELVNGKLFEGKVMQLERSDAGHEVVIVNKLGQLAIIPYHAVISVTLVG